MAARRHQDQRDRHVRAGHAQEQALAEQQERVVRRHRRGSTGAATTPRTWTSGWRPWPASRASPPTSSCTRPTATGPGCTLFDQHKGKIDADFGFKRVHHAAAGRRLTRCDAKFTTSGMAKELKTWALFGPPLGRTWEPTEARADDITGIRPLVSNDWTILSAEAARQPPRGTSRRRGRPRPDRRLTPTLAARIHTPAWHGTILTEDRCRHLARRGASPTTKRSSRSKSRSNDEGKERDWRRTGGPGTLRASIPLSRRDSSLGKDVPLAKIRERADELRLVRDRRRQGGPAPGAPSGRRWDMPSSSP